MLLMAPLPHLLSVVAGAFTSRWQNWQIIALAFLRIGMCQANGGCEGRVPLQTQPLWGTSIGLPGLVSRREHPPHAPWRPKLNIVRVILAILLPPVGVLLTVGLGLHFWINILLTIFGYIPGIVHAVWIISSRAKERELRDFRYR